MLALTVPSAVGLGRFAKLAGVPLALGKVTYVSLRVLGEMHSAFPSAGLGNREHAGGTDMAGDAGGAQPDHGRRRRSGNGGRHIRTKSSDALEKARQKTADDSREHARVQRARSSSN